MHQVNKQTNKQKLPPFPPVNFQYITEADVCSMPPPSKQAKISLVEQATCGNVSNGTVFQNLRTALSSKVNTDILKEVPSDERVTISSPSSNSGNDSQNTVLQDTVKSLITCAVCLEIQGQSYQCANGHLICVHCATRLLQQHTSTEATCPSCRVPLQLGLRRCLLAEQLAAELPYKCRFCDTQMAKKLIEQHETVTCPVRPVMCRFSIIGCRWTGKWVELDSHMSQCAYKDKRISEIEPLLVTALEQSQLVLAEQNQFQRGLLTQLAKAPAGLKAFRRQIGVFRDTKHLDPVEQCAQSTAFYQSTSNQFRCCGLRRATLETTLDFTQGQLCYRIRSKSEQTSEISFRLCLVRCGDVQFDVSDQLHSFTFGPNQKESPSYVTKLVYHRAAEANNESSITLSQLTVQSAYVGFPVETLKQSNNLLLEFILLKDRCDVLELRLNGNNNEYSGATTELISEVPENFNANSESTNLSDADEMQRNISNENNDSQSYWQQLLQSPPASLLRPLLNLFFSNQDRTAGNNNAPFVIGSLPQSLMVTLTSLSPTDTRIRLVGLRNGTRGTLEDTENEDSDEYSSVDDDVLEDDDNANTSEDEVDSTEESDMENEIDEHASGRNNNALDSELNEETHEPTSALGTHSELSAGGSLESMKSPGLQSLTTQAFSYMTSPPSVRMISATNRSNSFTHSTERRKIIRPVRRGTARVRSNPQRRLNSNANMSATKRAAQHLRRGHADCTIRDTTGNDNSEDHDNHARPNLSDYEVGPSDPKRMEHHVMQEESTNHNESRCRPTPWLQNFIHKFTGIARFLIRTHVATPLSYLTQPSKTYTSDHYQNQSASDSLASQQCEEQLEQTPFSITTYDISPRPWKLPMIASNLDKENSSLQESELNKAKYLPVDSLPPMIRSLRADISREIIRLARRTSESIEQRQSTVASSTKTTTTMTTTIENNVTAHNNSATSVQSERACQTTTETHAAVRNRARNWNTTHKQLKHPRRSALHSRNQKPRDGRK